MKDYYVILGVNTYSSSEEIKKAYRKLSLKFHPDKNDGDEFFTNRFKEIQEAYEILNDENKRKIYDQNLKENQTKNEHNKYFQPKILKFSANKTHFKFNEIITFYWNTINSDDVKIDFLGNVETIGEKSFKIKNFKDEKLTVEITAKNSFNNSKTISKIILINDTYKELEKHFEDKFKIKKQETIINNDISENNKSSSFWILFIIVCALLITAAFM